MKMKVIVVYSRVSSDTQNIQMQKSNAKHYLESLDEPIDINNVKFLDDQGVSAIKNTVENRPKLNELLIMVKEGIVKKVIFYKRDRISRNFYEYTEIARLLIEYGVEVVFTASNEPAFSNKLSLEGFYSIFSQQEGHNLKTRTDDARKQYPSQIFGYSRLKDENDSVSYVAITKKRKLIQNFFQAVSSVSNQEQFFEILLEQKTYIGTPELMFRILSNPFYSGHILMATKYQPMKHVEPIVTLELFLKANTQFNQYIAQFQEEMLNIRSQRMYLPTCTICNQIMKHKKKDIFDIGYYVCSKGHPRISINVTELNTIVKSTILEILSCINASTIKKLVLNRIVNVQKALKKFNTELQDKYREASIVLSTTDYKNSTLLESMLADISKLTEEHTKTNSLLNDLHILNNEVNELLNIVEIFNSTLSEEDIVRLIELLVEAIYIDNGYVDIHLYFSEFIEGVG